MDRMPVVAGRFYPADEKALAAQVDGFLGEPREEETAMAVISPHAGYAYSGAIAGSVFSRVRVPRLVVVLCPNHTGIGARAAIMAHGSFRLPGASIAIDGPLAEEFRGLALLTDDPRAHREEHSLEVQLPFLLRKNPKVRIVPVCLGAMPYASCARIGVALADVVKNHGDVLVVSSTDMSHYLPVADAERRDRLAIDKVLALDPKGLYETVRDNDISMCGVIPTTVALVAAVAGGAKEAELVHYGHSGQASGDLERVVGYAGMIIR